MDTFRWRVTALALLTLVVVSCSTAVAAPTQTGIPTLSPTVDLTTIAYSWRQVPYTSCEGECGAAVQSATAECYSSHGFVVPALDAVRLCGADNKPGVEMACEIEACIASNGTHNGGMLLLTPASILFVHGWTIGATLLNCIFFYYVVSRSPNAGCSVNRLIGHFASIGCKFTFS
jgi:hypothetical protein